MSTRFEFVAIWVLAFHAAAPLEPALGLEIDGLFSSYADSPISSAAANSGVWISDWMAPIVTRHDDDVEQAQYQPFLLPQPQMALIGPPSQLARSRPTSMLAANRLGTIGSNYAQLASLRSKGPIASASLVLGSESNARATTDAGDLIRKSAAALGVGAASRTPIVTDTRPRGSRTGQTLASGSYWVPARMDLDTMLSKLDSRIVDNILVVNGPYSVRHGPGFDFVDVQTLRAPRYQDGWEWHGNSNVEFKTNGQQWYGRQTLLGGSVNSGFRVGYGHRTGNDYVSGDDTSIPSSYNSRDFDFAYGIDLDDESSIEIGYLRLDQSNVEFPGQAFDINWLVTDGMDLTYARNGYGISDRIEFQTWYNRTRFEGDNLRSGKRRQFPFLVTEDLAATTDVDSMSTGYSVFAVWELGPSKITAGSDLRYVEQELNEQATQSFGELGGNSPIPRSHWSNPGLFVDYVEEIGERWRVSAGSRVDWVSSNIETPLSELDDLGIRDLVFDNPSSLADILGTDDFDRDEDLLAAYLQIEHHLGSIATVSAGAGYAERPPTLTERYAAQPFMFILQNGLNTLTGDPTLAPERRWQIDTGFRVESEHTRWGVNGFHAWVYDYITFENLDAFPPGSPEQVRLRFKNTDLATLVGGEMYFEHQLSPLWTLFATSSYLDGRDRSRNSGGATEEVEIGVSPTRVVAGLPRGSFSGVAGGSQEPLPNILPLESRVGLRIQQPGEDPRWHGELSARLVAAQSRVATSLMETTTPGFVIWDIKGVWQATDRLLLTGGVENFTNRNFREHLDFRPLHGAASSGALAMLQPGVNLYFGTEFNY